MITKHHRLRARKPPLTAASSISPRRCCKCFSVPSSCGSSLLTSQQHGSAEENPSVAAIWRRHTKGNRLLRAAHAAESSARSKDADDGAESDSDNDEEGISRLEEADAVCATGMRCFGKGTLQCVPFGARRVDSDVLGKMDPPGSVGEHTHIRFGRVALGGGTVRRGHFIAYRLPEYLRRAEHCESHPIAEEYAASFSPAIAEDATRLFNTAFGRVSILIFCHLVAADKITNSWLLAGPTNPPACWQRRRRGGAAVAFPLLCSIRLSRRRGGQRQLASHSPGSASVPHGPRRRVASRGPCQHRVCRALLP